MLCTLFPVQTVTYIGETGRTLKICMVEHKRAVKSKDPLNGIAAHVQKTTHNINWQEARILAREIKHLGKKKGP